MRDDRTSREVERKFLVDRVPAEVCAVESVRIRQGYLAVSSESEVRIRDSDGDYTLTVKSGRGIERAESEVQLLGTQFEKLWPMTEGHRVEKRRMRVALEDGLVAELDVYEGGLEGLVTVEVEFASRREADEFVPPSWFGEDVSEDHRYKNASLARFGSPVR